MKLIKQVTPMDVKNYSEQELFMCHDMCVKKGKLTPITSISKVDLLYKLARDCLIVTLEEREPKLSRLSDPRYEKFSELARDFEKVGTRHHEYMGVCIVEADGTVVPIETLNALLGRWQLNETFYLYK